VRSGLAIFAADPLVAAPGEKFHYSTYGWSLLSAAMETAAKRDFPGFMEAEVLRPLGLERTRVDRAGLADRDRAHFYVPGPDGKFRPARPINSSYKWAGGGYLSTAEDLVRYGSALLGPGFLRQASLAQLFTPQRTAAGQSTGYGIGWSLGGNQRSPAYWHTGGQPGCTAILLIRPRDRVVVAILTNISDSEITKQAGAIADLFAARPN
jgi:serine beta-lactamase-like protein LACTB, mitochondrial